VTTTPFDPGDPQQRRYVSWGRAPFPDPRDADVDAYVRALREGGQPAVAATVAAVSERGRKVLRAYAERAATRAVRNDAADLLVLASIALVMGGLDQNDREALLRMPLVEDASRRIGVDLATVFEEVAGLVGHPGTVNLVLWLSRAPEDRTLEGIGFAAGDDGDGFRYRWIA
jgi:hypothetical protein